MEKLAFICLLFISTMASCQDTTKTATRSWEVKMTEKDEPGKKFTLDITVLDISTKQPIKDAEIFAYHTNHKGDYLNDAKGVAKIHGTAWSNESGAIRFITIYPRGYNDSPSGEHIHFRTKAVELEVDLVLQLFNEIMIAKSKMILINLFYCLK